MSQLRQRFEPGRSYQLYQTFKLRQSFKEKKTKQNFESIWYLNSQFFYDFYNACCKWWLSAQSESQIVLKVLIFKIFATKNAYS
jgi:hypothetical protein